MDMLHLSVLAAALSLLLAACGAAGPTTAPATTAPATTAPAPSGEDVPLLTAARPPDACMDALASGRLVATPVSGLGLLAADGSLMAVEWPFGYRAVIVGGLIVLLDDEGRAVARVGDTIQVGGGFGVRLWHACAPVEVVQRP